MLKNRKCLKIEYSALGCLSIIHPVCSREKTTLPVRRLGSCCYARGLAHLSLVDRDSVGLHSQTDALEDGRVWPLSQLAVLLVRVRFAKRRVKLKRENDALAVNAGVS